MEERKIQTGLGRSYQEFVVLLPSGPLREKPVDPSGSEVNTSRCVMVQHSSPGIFFFRGGNLVFFTHNLWDKWTAQQEFCPIPLLLPAWLSLWMWAPFQAQGNPCILPWGLTLYYSNFWVISISAWIDETPEEAEARPPVTLRTSLFLVHRTIPKKSKNPR